MTTITGRRARLPRRTRGRAPALAEQPGSGLPELVEQLPALLIPETLDPARLADADLVHQPAGLHLPETGQRFEDGEDLHLADDLVALGLVEELLEGERTHLELLLQLGALATGGGRLVERRLTLLWRERGRQRHGPHPSATGGRASRPAPVRPLTVRATPPGPRRRPCGRPRR